ncbi:MAG: hypothetical protein Q9222_002146 [Ikaeria aurantiellina]
MRLWVDAICINQNNIAERSNQVSLMGDTYAIALCTVAWLGEEDEHSRKVLGFIKYLGPLLRSVDVSLRRKEVEGHTSDEQIDYPIFGADVVADDVWRSYKLFYRRTWFERAWVVQEYVVAKSTWILCGDDVCRMDDLRRVSHFTVVTGWDVLTLDESDTSEDLGNLTEQLIHVGRLACVLLLDKHVFDMAEYARNYYGTTTDEQIQYVFLMQALGEKFQAIFHMMPKQIELLRKIVLQPLDRFLIPYIPSTIRESFFQASDGYIGISTSMARKGDTIWILQDARIPFALGAVPNTNQYQLVGDAYLHGFMQGEIMQSGTAQFQKVIFV